MFFKYIYLAGIGGLSIYSEQMDMDFDRELPENIDFVARRFCCLVKTMATYVYHIFDLIKDFTIKFFYD